MMINHEQHRIGLGSVLVKHCEKVLFEKYQELKLESFEYNEKANNFYLKKGWEILRTEHDEISGSNKYIFTKQQA